MSNSLPQRVPTKTQILVIGGGPSGAYAATLLAREKFDVTLLEREFFPRYHIGESLLPSIPHYLALVDGYELFAAKGFKIKPGAAVKFNQYSRESYTDFSNLKEGRVTWNVTRSEFDDLLLKHAANNGVRVFEGTKATSIQFEPTELGQRPVSAEWLSKSGDQGRVQFDWLIDASGRAGILSTQYLHNRTFTQGLKNIAIWAYWSSGGSYGAGTEKEDAPIFEALSDETGWSWYIPLAGGTVSVGVVMSEEAHARKKSDLRKTNADCSASDYYLAQVQLSPSIAQFLKHAQMTSSIKSASDYSYDTSTKGGPGFRIVGDAAAFIDPFFSSGVHLALTTALSAACSIAASIRGNCAENDAVAFHNAKCGTAYTRFLIVVLSAYKQMRAQQSPILQDVDEENFDRAFALIRPLMRGEADVSTGLTEQELQKAIEFCAAVFAPTSPEMHREVAQRLDTSLTDAKGPVLLPEHVLATLGESDADAVHVITRINARKPIHTDVNDVREYFLQEEFCGLIPNIERGKLGLRVIAA